MSDFCYDCDVDNSMCLPSMSMLRWRLNPSQWLIWGFIKAAIGATLELSQSLLLVSSIRMASYIQSHNMDQVCFPLIAQTSDLPLIDWSIHFSALYTSSQKATTTLAIQPHPSSATPTRCKKPRDGESRTSFDWAPIEIPSFPRSPPKSQPWSNPAFCLWTFEIGPGVFGRSRLDLISSHPPTITSFSIYCEQFNSLYFF